MVPKFSGFGALEKTKNGSGVKIVPINTESQSRKIVFMSELKQNVHQYLIHWLLMPKAVTNKQGYKSSVKKTQDGSTNEMKAEEMQ